MAWKGVRIRRTVRRSLTIEVLMEVDCVDDTDLNGLVEMASSYVVKEKQLHCSTEDRCA